MAKELVMDLQEAKNIIEAHLEWVDQSKNSPINYDYTEDAFNQALRVVVNHLNKEESIVDYSFR